MALAAGHLAVAVACAVAITSPPASPLAWVVVTIGLVVAGLARIELEHRRSRVTVTPTHAVLVVAFGLLPVAGIAVAAGIGEVVSLALRRVDRFKVAYNGAGRAFAAAAGAATYWSLQSGEGVARWPAALAAVVVFTLANLLATSAAVAVVEGRTLRGVYAHGAPTALLAAAIAAPLGLVTEELWRQAPLAPLVLAPLVAAVALNARAAAAGRREHRLVVGLYAAVRDTSRLRSAEETASTVAANVIDMLVATGAACLWRTSGGTWHGVASGELLVRSWPEAGESLAAVVGGSEEVVLTGDAAAGAIAGRDGVLLAARQVDASIDVILVARRRAPDGLTPTPELSTLRALAAHAALGLQNSALLTEVERALVRQIDLNREKGEFVATVSHELRTPLSSMSGFVDTVMRLSDRLGPERSRDYLERALEQGGRLARLIDDLLVVAAADHTRLAVRHDVIRVPALLADIRRAASGVAGDRLQVGVDPRAPELVVTDHDKALRIALNLVENAAKYSDGDIRLRVEAGTDTIDLLVEDDGPGIPEEHAERVFQPFVQLDQSATRRHGGTGLGLHLCRQLASLLGGELGVEQAPGGGARFRLRLPDENPHGSGSVEPAPVDDVSGANDQADQDEPLACSSMDAMAGSIGGAPGAPDLAKGR